MPAATDATRMDISPATARRLPRDAIDATSQDIWLKIVKMKLRADHATTAAKLVTCNAIANRPAARHATNARSPDTWPVTAPLR